MLSNPAVLTFGQCHPASPNDMTFVLFHCYALTA